jgi:hypothetical protein
VLPIPYNVLLSLDQTIETGGAQAVDSDHGHQTKVSLLAVSTESRQERAVESMQKAASFIGLFSSLIEVHQSPPASIVHLHAIQKES